jgi:predicted neutral ceramidase superfamily lipid hydrolase
MAEETQDRESRNERLNRELIELLQELRVILPGVQVLFAFLLTIPFNQRFEILSERQKDVYYGAVLCTAAAAILLIAAPNLHRFLFRASEKEWVLRTSNRLTLLGTGALAIAMTAAIYLITDVLHAGVTVPVVTGLTVLAMAWLWFALPLARRARINARADSP